MRFVYSLLLGLFVVAATAASKQPTAAHWVQVKDAYRVHERWVVTQADGSENVLGELYQLQPNDVHAQCYDGPPAEFATVYYARQYVQACPVWR